MGISTNILDEIFKERVRYLGNIDELMFEMHRDRISGNGMDFKHEPPISSGFEDMDVAGNVKVVDRLFASKEYKTYIELISHIVERKINQSV